MKKPGEHVQKKFFDELKIILPDNLSLPNVVADELNISIDSAYRRIRGDSELSLREFDLLTSKYHVSLDGILQQYNDLVSFTYRAISKENSGLQSYFVSIAEEIESLISFGIREVIYVAADLPIFYYFTYPALAAFKHYCWQRELLSDAREGKQMNKFYASAMLQNNFSKLKRLFELYQQTPCTEIWSEDTLNSTLRQIRFYYQIGLFSDKKVALNILNELKKIIRNLERQAMNNSKFFWDTSSLKSPENGNFNLYFNKTGLSENVILISLEKYNLVHLGYNALNILTSFNQAFFENSYRNAQKIIANSISINDAPTMEKEAFFNGFNDKIDAVIDVINQ